MSSGPLARLVQQPGARRPKTLDGGREVRNLERHVVQAGAALLEEFGDGGIGGRGLQELDARIAGWEHGDVDLFGGDGFAVSDGEAQGLVEGEGGVEGGD